MAFTFFCHVFGFIAIKRHWSVDLLHFLANSGAYALFVMTRVSNLQKKNLKGLHDFILITIKHKIDYISFYHNRYTDYKLRMGNTQ